MGGTKHFILVTFVNPEGYPEIAIGILPEGDWGTCSIPSGDSKLVAAGTCADPVGHPNMAIGLLPEGDLGDLIFNPAGDSKLDSFGTCANPVGFSKLATC